MLASVAARFVAGAMPILPVPGRAVSLVEAHYSARTLPGHRARWLGAEQVTQCQRTEQLVADKSLVPVAGTGYNGPFLLFAIRQFALMT